MLYLFYSNRRSPIQWSPSACYYWGNSDTQTAGATGCFCVVWMGCGHVTNSPAVAAHLRGCCWRGWRCWCPAGAPGSPCGRGAGWSPSWRRSRCPRRPPPCGTPPCPPPGGPPVDAEASWVRAEKVRQYGLTATSESKRIHRTSAQKQQCSNKFTQDKEPLSRKYISRFFTTNTQGSTQKCDLQFKRIGLQGIFITLIRSEVYLVCLLRWRILNEGMLLKHKRNSKPLNS